METVPIPVERHPRGSPAWVTRVRQGRPAAAGRSPRRCCRCAGRPAPSRSRPHRRPGSAGRIGPWTHGRPYGMSPRSVEGMSRFRRVTIPLASPDGRVGGQAGPTAEDLVGVQMTQPLGEPGREGGRPAFDPVGAGGLRPVQRGGQGGDADGLDEADADVFGPSPTVGRGQFLLEHGNPACDIPEHPGPPSGFGTLGGNWREMQRKLETYGIGRLPGLGELTGSASGGRPSVVSASSRR